MPITASEIIEDSEQADGRRWVTEKHTAGTGKKYRITYLAPSGFDITLRMQSRVVNLDQKLKDIEVSKYVDRIEQGTDPSGFSYPETTIQYRVLQLLVWLKEKVAERDLQAVQYAPLVFNPYTETQINGLLAGTDFENKADQIILWMSKITDMKTAIDEAEAGEV